MRHTDKLCGAIPRSIATEHHRVAMPQRRTGKSTVHMDEMNTSMINFDEEVLKFRPCLEIDETEDEIYRNEQRDLQDIIDSVVMSAQNTEYTEQ